MSETTTETKPQSVREWAIANGYDVKPRGRLSAYVKQAYAQAHGV